MSEGEIINLSDEELQFCMDCQYLGRDYYESDEHIGIDEDGEFRERLCPKCHSLAYVTASPEERGE